MTAFLLKHYFILSSYLWFINIIIICINIIDFPPPHSFIVLIDIQY